MRKWLRILKERKGTTLVEMLVCLTLISIMLSMAAGALSSASRIFIRIQKQQYAQSILDTVMTELRNQTKDATTYVKIYDNGGNIAETAGKSSGNAIEFMNSMGYVVLLTTDGCDTTTLFVKDTKLGEQDPVEKGRLLTRYYSRKPDKTYTYVKAEGTSDQPVVRAMAEAFGTGFYMKNYLNVVYSVPDTTADGVTVKAVTATATLYSDEACTNAIASDTEILDFRYDVKYNTGLTAVRSTN